MKKLAAFVALMLTISTAADAGERVTDTALGAVAGAVVLGPIGAAAGAFIGYTAGPSMSRAWGVRGGRSASSSRQPRRTASNEPPAYRESQAAMPAPSSAPARPVAAKPGPRPPAVQPLE